MDIIEKGILIQEKRMLDETCANCEELLFIQVYKYDKILHNVIHCKKCNTFSHIKKPKNYNMGLKEVEIPDFLKKK